MLMMCNNNSFNYENKYIYILYILCNYCVKMSLRYQLAAQMVIHCHS